MLDKTHSDPRHLCSNLRQATSLECKSSLYQGAEQAKETQRDFRWAKESKLEARTVFNWRILSSREAGGRLLREETTVSAKSDELIDFYLRKLTVCDEVVQERDISRLKKIEQQKTAMKKIA